MLSLLAGISMYALPPVYILLTALGKEPRLARRRPRYRLRLRAVAILMVVLAIDFAALSVLVRHSKLSPLLFASDTAVILIPLIFGMSASYTYWELWVLACLVGLVGGLLVPWIVMR
ncbi:MAG TPA: hypothetical protein VG406_25555 [Isosphaeraceae bacterium]|jgi:hypothetical protein|nr:hypothetical protein [Isosphaeraceae bacterium]